MPENRQATKEQYLRALEQRVNQLESALSAARDINAAGGGITPLVSPALEQPGQIQWIPPPPSLQRSSHYSNLDRAELPSLSIPSPTMIAHDSLAGKPEDHIDPKSVNSVTDILRDLSIEASGGYIGASSNITMGRMIGTLVKSKESQNISNMKSPKSLYQPASPASTRDNIQSNLLKGDVCDRLLLGYLKHISLRWPILRTSFIRALHNQREILVEPYKKTVLHLVYAIGGRFLETTGQAGTFFTEEHHSAALQQLDDILAYHDVRSIIVLLLLAIHSLRAPKGPGAWTYVGLAMRLCIDLGLHRKRGPSHLQINNPRALADLEMRKRVFWTAYCLDRQVSIVLGRPFAISDRDIDADVSLVVS
jgi:hypothetical protein